MFHLWSPRRQRDCDGASRRDFLRVGALGIGGGLLLPDLLRARASAAAAGNPTKNASVIWLWLGGGPTHIETFDPKMTAPAEFRSTVGATKTNVVGVELGGLFTKLAKVADRMAFVRSFAHGNSGHGGGTHWVMTGYNYPPADNNMPPVKPGLGAVLSRARGATGSRGLPTYVRLSGIYGDGAAWLGPAYNPFDTSGPGRNNMALQGTLDRLADRRHLLKSFDTLNREVDKSGLVDGLDSFGQQAFDLIRSRAREAFDVQRDDPRTRDRYGPGLGEQLLTARRLCEAGVGFVTMHFGGWDMHGQVANGMKSLGLQVDQAVSALVEDLGQRGLDREVLLVITGEFGRTPRINGGAGRDHWAPLSTLALAGGGLKMGQVIGQSSAKAEVPKSTPITPQDLMATVFHVVGLPQDLHFRDQSGRPVPMIDGGKPIAELL